MHYGIQTSQKHFGAIVKLQFGALNLCEHFTASIDVTDKSQKGLDFVEDFLWMLLGRILLVSENVDVGLSVKRPSKELTYSKRELAKKEFGRGIVT